MRHLPDTAGLRDSQPRTGLFSVPVVGVTGLGVGFGDGSALEDYIQHGIHWRDVITYIRGNHAFKVGYEGWHGDDLAYFAGRYSQPTFSFTSMINLINNNPYTETIALLQPRDWPAGSRYLRLREDDRVAHSLKMSGRSPGD